MMRSALTASILAIGCVLVTFAPAVAQRPDPVVQVEDSSELWEVRPMPFPPLESILARPVEARPIYGLYGWGGEYMSYRQQIGEVGYRSYRISGQMTDEVMAMLVEDDMEAMMTLTFRTDEGRQRRPDFASDEAFIVAYIDYVEDFLTRYGPNGTFFDDNGTLPHRPIRYVEILNEPNFQYVIPDQGQDDVEAEREALYAELLPRVYTAIKDSWPDVTVVGFGTGGSGSGDVRFIEHVHEQNGAVGSSYDVLSTHPYNRPAPYEAFLFKPWGGYAPLTNYERIREAMTAAGAGERPVWYTEVGWTISHADGGYYTDAEAPGPHITPALHAAYVCRLYATSMRIGVGRVHIMHAMDTDGFNGGVFLRNGDFRPAAYATQTMIRLMPNPRLVGVDDDGQGGQFVYRFDPDHTDEDTAPIVMVWNITGPTTIDVSVGGATAATAVDMYGYETALEIDSGRVSVPAGPCPVYVVLDESNPEAPADAPGNDIDVYHIGNSLTRGLSVDRVADLFAAAGGHYDHGTQLGGGRALFEHLANLTADGDPFQTNNFQTQAYGDWEEAFANHSFDAIVMQTYGA